MIYLLTKKKLYLENLLLILIFYYNQIFPKRKDYLSLIISTVLLKIKQQ
jgi:hypothetical protein